VGRHRFDQFIESVVQWDMARNPDVLSDVQYAVLRIVANGSNTAALEDRGRRITARALHNKALLIVSGRGSSWQARMTESGLRALEAYRLRVEVPQFEATRLYAMLVANGGRIDVVDFDTQVAEYALLAASLNAPGRPRGWKLEHRINYGREGPPQSWLLVEHFADAVVARHIPVPELVKRFHPALAEFRMNRVAAGLSVDEFARASRILHAIAIEAEARGYSVLDGEKPDRRFPGRAANLKIAIRGDAHPVIISSARPSEAGGRPWLQLKLPHSEFGRDGGEWRFVDRSKRVLEERLSDLFREIEITQLRDERRAEARRSDEVRRKAAQEKVDAAAKLKREFDRKVAVLRDQVERHNEAESIRHYAAHVRTSRAPISVAAEEWVVWAEAYAETIDPARDDLMMP
jgi:hypothetical protein